MRNVQKGPQSPYVKKKRGEKKIKTLISHTSLFSRNIALCELQFKQNGLVDKWEIRWELFNVSVMQYPFLKVPFTTILQSLQFLEMEQSCPWHWVENVIDSVDCCIEAL